MECPVDIIETSPNILGEGRWINETIYEFTPYYPWKAGASYAVNLKSDSASDLFDPQLIQDWSFSVASPQVVDVFPSYNAGNVRLDTDIHIWFNTPMDQQASGDAFALNVGDGRAIPGIVNWEDNGMHLIFTPAATLEYETPYIVSLGSRARAVSSTPLSTPQLWQFMTTQFPVIEEIEPVDAAVPVTVNTPLRIKVAGNFDEQSLLSNVVLMPAFDDHLKQLFSKETKK